MVTYVGDSNDKSTAAVQGEYVFGNGEGGVGVFGLAGFNSYGVYGANGGDLGLPGTTSNSPAVPGGAGVYGYNSDGGPGVCGAAGPTGNGVQGTTSDSNSSGVHGINTGGGSGLFGTSVSGNAIAGTSQTGNAAFFVGVNGVYAKGSANAGIFDGHVQHNGNVTTTGTHTVHGDIVLAGADCAEEFDVTEAAEMEPGTVVVMDQNGAMRSSQQAYDKKVAGVISGAGDYKPGMILDKKGASEGRMPIALIGKVYCKVDAQYSPVEVGDLLTTSPTPGHAMRASDPMQAFGAVLGKALRGLPAGQGLIPMLVALQ